MPELYRLAQSAVELDLVAGGYLPVVTTAPTEAPTAIADKAPFVVEANASGDKIWVYVRGAWKSANLV